MNGEQSEIKKRTVSARIFKSGLALSLPLLLSLGSERLSPTTPTAPTPRLRLARGPNTSSRVIVAVTAERENASSARGHAASLACGCGAQIDVALAFRAATPTLVLWPTLALMVASEDAGGARGGGLWS